MSDSIQEEEDNHVFTNKASYYYIQSSIELVDKRDDPNEEEDEENSTNSNDTEMTNAEDEEKEQKEPIADNADGKQNNVPEILEDYYYKTGIEKRLVFKWGDVVQINSDYRNCSKYLWNTQHWIPVDCTDHEYGLVPRQFSLFRPDSAGYGLPLDYFAKTVDYHRYHAWSKIMYALYEEQLVSNCKLADNRRTIFTTFQRKKPQVQEAAAADEQEVVTIESSCVNYYYDRYIRGCESIGMGSGPNSGWNYRYAIVKPDRYYLDPRLKAYSFPDQRQPETVFELRFPDRELGNSQMHDFLTDYLVEDIHTEQVSVDELKTKFLEEIRSSWYLEQDDKNKFVV